MASEQNAYRASAGDGIAVEGLGPLAVTNVLVVANEAGTQGHLIAAIVNNTDEEHVLHVEVGDDTTTTLRIEVPAESTVSYGERESLDEPPLIERLDAVPGSMVSMHFRVGESAPVSEEVPVLNGCLDYLEGLEPGDRGIFADCPP